MRSILLLPLVARCLVIWNTWKVHYWFSNNRSQFVHYNDYNSERKHIPHGVTQVSTLGPLLFIIYIMTFPEAHTCCFPYHLPMTQVFIEGTNYDKVINILNQQLKRIDIWLKANNLTINIKINSLYDVSPNMYQM